MEYRNWMMIAPTQVLMNFSLYIRENIGLQILRLISETEPVAACM